MPPLAPTQEDPFGNLQHCAALWATSPPIAWSGRYGLVAFASSLDQIGVFTRSVEDAAIVIETIAGFDPKDATSTEQQTLDLQTHLHDPIDGLRIGVPTDFMSDRNDQDVNTSIQTAVDVYRNLGATVVDIALPLSDLGISTYYVIATAEASSNLARYDGIKYGHRTSETGGDLFDLYAMSRAEGFGEEVKRRIMLGTYVLSSGYYDAYYNNALKVRRLISEEYDKAFEQCDVILGPTAPTPAFKIGAKTEPISMYLCDVYTANTNIAGICGISIPCGFSEKEESRLPIGLHLQGSAFSDSTLLRVANAFEKATDHHLQHPRCAV